MQCAFDHDADQCLSIGATGVNIIGRNHRGGCGGRTSGNGRRCHFAVFERAFGTVPRLRAALHGGSVITGEVGGSRRAIVYHGDVVNTASRMEQAARDFQRQFLVSGDALQRLAGLGGFVLEDLGLQHLRGRTAAMHVYAVTARKTVQMEADLRTTARSRRPSAD